jgi:hypothetical protein
MKEFVSGTNDTVTRSKVLGTRDEVAHTQKILLIKDNFQLKTKLEDELPELGEIHE